MDLDVAAATSAAQAGAPVRPLAGRSAVVTGSTSGIGLGIARALAAAGADVMLNGFGDPVAIDRLCRELEARCGVTVAHSAADMQRPEQIQAMLGEAGERLGGVDILVCNAGIQHVAPLEEFPPAKWDAILAINLTAAFHAMRLVIPAMRAQGWGRIVNIASAHGLVASPFKSAYVAAKHGLIGLTKVAALELAESGITCNAICPGYVWTPLVERQIEEQAAAHGIAREQVVKEVLLASQPSKRFAAVEELGALTLFLCTGAAASITGTALPVDGGWTAH
ncbi:MAG: 3-hydroxybutyrate dehydrogenase [Geminicoccaceae bacterium]